MHVYIVIHYYTFDACILYIDAMYTLLHVCVLGDHTIEINCFGLLIPQSPFTAKAWDVSKVVVSNVTNGRVGCQSTFNSMIDVSCIKFLSHVQ